MKEKDAKINPSRPTFGDHLHSKVVLGRKVFIITVGRVLCELFLLPDHQPPAGCGDGSILLHTLDMFAQEIELRVQVVIHHIVLTRVTATQYFQRCLLQLQFQGPN